MPQLLIFVPCEKVIVSGGELGDGTTSLITLIQGITADIAPVERKIDRPTVGIMWFAYALWKTPPEDHGVEFEQVVTLFTPSRAPVIKVSQQFTAATDFQRVVARIIGMPVAEEGEYALAIRLSRTDAPDKTIASSEYPIRVQHNSRAAKTKEELK